MKYQVGPAVLTGDLSSLGEARNKLVRQYQFPDVYDTDVGDVLLDVDHDRLLQRHYTAMISICQWRMRRGILGLKAWSKTHAHSSVMRLLKDLFELDEWGLGTFATRPVFKKTKWTGYRITASIVPDGKVLFHLSLFSKGADSKTKVYTGNKAPNVKRPNGLRPCDLVGWPGYEKGQK
jgi:hypothetical protein